MSSREEERWGLARAAALRDAGPGGARRGNNALTALFLQALAEVAHGEGRPNRVSNLQRAAQGVLNRIQHLKFLVTHGDVRVRIHVVLSLRLSAHAGNEK